MSYETHHEKMTDVNISVELMADAFQDAFDVALLVSADSDLVGPARTIRRLFKNKRVVVAFPPERFSSALKQVADGQLFVSRDVLAKSIFSEEVKKPDGFLLRRPVTTCASVPNVVMSVLARLRTVIPPFLTGQVTLFQAESV
ncbi:MAG TPA: NYN domain-containing protein [Anaerolineales bacterium]|nr:NYN domain-containing protein [Anaerolineales bacterium]